MDSGNMMRGVPYPASADLHHHHGIHHQAYSKPPAAQQQLPVDPDLRGTPPAADHGGGKREQSKISTSEDDDNEDCTEVERGARKGGGSPWHRMKWTDAMVRLLITIVSYIGEDAASDGRRRRMSLLQKKGKWKLVSRVMAERGFFVSPQQCEDKFNDLNKRYKRLNEILGRGTSCEVVENPALLDALPHVSDKGKEDVRKILSSKHLFYEEMCSYHNGNRLHLPHDPSLQLLLQQALHSKDDNDNRKGSTEEELGGGAETDENEDEVFENPRGGGGGGVGGSGCFHNHKRVRGVGELDGGAVGDCAVPQDCDKGVQSQGFFVDINQVFSEAPRDPQSQRQWLSVRSVQLEEQRLQIQAQMLELEGHRFKWQRFSKKKDRELERMGMENERMKLENERLTLELKRKALEAGIPNFIA